MPILWRLKDRIWRYGELRKSLKNVTHKMLTQQLRELEADGVKLLIDTIVENRGLGLVEQARERERSNAICVSIYKMCVQRVRKRFRWVDG